MADEFDENDFEEDFQEADEPEDLNDDLDAGEGEQEQIDILPAGKQHKVWEIRNRTDILLDTAKTSAPRLLPFSKIFKTIWIKD